MSVDILVFIFIHRAVSDFSNFCVDDAELVLFFSVVPFPTVFFYDGLLLLLPWAFVAAVVAVFCR